MRNLKRLSLPELNALRDRVKVQLAHRQDQELAKARERVQAMADELNVKPADLIKSPPKYRHPENPDLTWTGKGRAPRWVHEYGLKG